MTTTTSGPKDKLTDYSYCELIMKRIYSVYADYALKNPFHTPEMPIRSEGFDIALLATLKT